MHPRRRAEYLAGRALLRYALARHSGRDATSFAIRITSAGKPECVDGPAISVSHSGELVVCAVAEQGSVGIDVETGRRHTPFAAIAERYFTAAEARWLAADPEGRFRMLWVLKEAYLKVLGVGLAGGIDSLECRIDPPAIVAQVARGGDAPHLALWAGQACCLGVAAAAASRAIAIERWSPRNEPDAFGPFVAVARTE